MTTRKELLEREYAPQTTEQLSTATEKRTFKTTEQLTTVSSVDQALFDTHDLINQKFKPWYAKQALRLGVPRYLALAADARRTQSGSPQVAFSRALKGAA